MRPVDGSEAQNTFTAFGFRMADNTTPPLAADVVGTITGRTISVVVPSGTNLGALQASWTSSSTHVRANGMMQTSGVTPNDFSGGVQYVVGDPPTEAFYVVLVTVTPAAALFSVGPDFTTGTNPFAIATGDFNFDGIADLVAATEEQDAGVSVLLGTSAPGATSPAFLADAPVMGTLQVRGVAVGDVNGDGKPDLAYTRSDDSVVVRVDTTGTNAFMPAFGPQSVFLVGVGPRAVALGDLNNDGILDLVVANAMDGSVSILRGTTALGGDPTFAQQVRFPTGVGADSLVLADFNHDGRLDVATSNGAASTGDPGTVSVLLNATAPAMDAVFSFGSRSDFDVGTHTVALAVADIDHDGVDDLVTASDTTTGPPVAILRGTTKPGAMAPTFGTRVLVQPASSSVPGAAPGTATGVAVGDVDGDGLADLVLARRATNSIMILRNLTAAASSAPVFATIYALPDAINGQLGVALVDVNRDGRLDIAAIGETGSAVSVLLNVGPRTRALGFAPKVDVASGSGPAAVTVADVNGDGWIDLAAACAGNATVAIALGTTVPGNSPPTFAGGTALAMVAAPTSLDVADFNHDGRPDLAVGMPASTAVVVLMNNSPPGSTAPMLSNQAQQVGTSTSAIAVGDLDRDGRQDLVAAQASGSAVRFLRGVTSFGGNLAQFDPAYDVTTCSGPRAVALVDINHDAVLDLVVACSSSTVVPPDVVSVRLNTTSPGQSPVKFAAEQIFTMGAGARALAVGDLNNDGRLDIITANQLAGTITVRLNQTVPGAAAADFSGAFAVTVGPMPAGLEIADLDADGRADVVVANGGGSTVSVLRNLTTPGALTPSFAASTEVSVGTGPTDVAIADVDHDGKLDLIVTIGAAAGTVSVVRGL